jgi:hypothetical protein
VCTLCFWSFQKCVVCTNFYRLSVSVHNIFEGPFERVLILFKTQFEECAGLFIAAQVCTVFPSLPPQIPGSGFRVLGPGWQFLLLESCHTRSTLDSLTTDAPEQHCAPNRPRHPAAQTGRVGPAAPSRGSWRRQRLRGRGCGASDHQADSRDRLGHYSRQTMKLP